MTAGNVIPLTIHKQEPRVDSRILARELGIQPGNLLETVYKYQTEIKDFGLLPFQTEAVKSAGSRGAKRQRYALLNEDQCHFVLTLSRNTRRVVELKARLVLALKKYRDGHAIEADYLPFYHELHDQVKTLAEQAHADGSTTPERVFHINVNRMVNKAFGLESGQRSHLPAELRIRVTLANDLARERIERAIDEGMDHHAAYAGAKAGVEAFARGYGLARRAA